MTQPAHSPPRVSVIIPAHNAESTLGATLDGLAAQDTEERFEVIVVDDGSSDGTAAVAESASLNLDLTVIRRRRGEGAGAARNEGAASARADVLAFTDADCVPASGWLREGLAGQAHAGLIQGAVQPDPAATLMPFDHTVWVGAESGLYETANLFVARVEFDRVGGFEDITQTGGRPFGEDAWLGWRLRRAGVESRFEPEALVYHAVFRRGPMAYVAEQRRLALFPFLVGRIPELRRSSLFCGAFLNGRSAAFDAALAGTGVAMATGALVPAALALPYLYSLLRGAIGWRRWAPIVIPAHLAADVVGFGALLWGSVKSRAVVI